MVATVNASTSAGVVITPDNSGVLAFQSSSATALTIDASQNSTFVGTASATKLIPTGTSVTGNGLYLPAANSLGLSTNGTARVRIYSDGVTKVATTGTTAPTYSFTNYGEGLMFSNGDNSGTRYSDIVSIGNTPAGATSNIRFWTNLNGVDAAVERARFTSTGFFKASNTGSYQNVAQDYPEFSTDQSAYYAFLVAVTNASYASDGLTTSFTTRTASSTFDAQRGYTSGGNVLYRIRGDGNQYTDGTYNNNGADYAEYFESANGQALTLGATVVLDGNKVREATDQDDVKNIIGVVRPKEPSKASMVVGNTAWNKWANKYLTDDFDRYIMEDHDVVEWTDEDGKKHSYESQSIPSGVTVPSNATRKTHDENGVKFQHYKINPEWNSESEYVNRENRPEWNIIGLLGQVKMLKGKPVGDRWIKMRNVSNTVEEWFIR
jgi:hypothetical protein